MSTSKHINKICIVVIALTLVLTVLFMFGSKLGITYAGHVMGYEDRLFSTDKVHTINLVVDDWDDFISNCENEEYINCAAVIDGESFKNIALRAKGNTSLSSVSASGSQRYSFKIEFDHYDSNKTYYGLDKLCLNNLIQDNTMMKDYLVYQMMDDFGVDTPLCSFVYITVNNEDWGLYLALEGVEDSFLERNYGSDSGDLYKPDSMSFGAGRGNGKGFNMDDFTQSGEENADSADSSSDSKGAAQAKQNPLEEQGVPQGGGTPQGTMPSQEGSEPQSPQGNDLPQGGTMQGGTQASGMQGGDLPELPEGTDPTQIMPGGDASGFPQGGEIPELPEGTDISQIMQGGGMQGGGMQGGMGSDDVKLKYIDDDPESYSNIFDNAKTDVTSEDKTRLIASLKNLSSYTNLESTVDMEEVIRYFVVHNFVCNDDSYTGTMIHNYYLNENDGILKMIPWDYNLAFGTFQGNNASSAVNSDIDNPVSNGNNDDRPMVGWIFSDSEYTDHYHELFLEYINEWFSDGKLDKLITDTAEMIRPYVEKDPTKFCTVDDFEAGISAIREFVSLRAEAVTKQLSGDTTAVDTGTLNLSDMGTMNNNNAPQQNNMEQEISFKQK